VTMSTSVHRTAPTCQGPTNSQSPWTRHPALAFAVAWCGLLRHGATLRVRRILRRLPPATPVFPKENAVVLDPTRGAFFAGCRTGWHRAAPTISGGRSSR
jgi:hypothetical protein